MTRPKAAGSPRVRVRVRALALALALAGGCGEELELELETEPAADPHAPARARLAAWEQAQRDDLDVAALPAADGRFGSDPQRLLALPDGRVAVLLRGADRLLLLDPATLALAIVASAATPHDPTDLIWRAGELLVVGTGEARIARYADADLEPRGDLALVDAFAPRVLASVGARVFVADEGDARLHALELGADGAIEARSVQPYCHGPIALEIHDDLLFGNCLLEHRLRVDRLEADGSLRELDGVHHDGPIWSFKLGPRTAEGGALLALTGVEDHPLDRSDGGFGYIDSFAWIYALIRDGDGRARFERRASVNLSALGVVTPKWSRWRSDADADAGVGLVVGGYGSAPILELRWVDGLAAAPRVRERPGLPGSSDALWLDEGRGALLAADPLLDRLLRLDPDAVASHDPAPDFPDDRRFAHRLGEALVFTTAMAPSNDATDRRSRFTCETCHFEGRGDGRVHFTGREFQGQKVHAVSKSLQGLFNNRPHFSRALDRRTATMVDNEFRVANRHSTLDPWFSLTPERLPWITALPGWPGQELDGEALRLALLQFLLRYTPTSNPAARGRAKLDALEAEGARLFAAHCEGCHQARLVADDPSTRLPFEQWPAAIFSASDPVVWASDVYVQTGIVPWVHPEGARVPSLRRIYLDWPYFTNGGADSLAAVLAGVRVGAGGCDHQLGPAPAGEGLDAHARAALLAFLRLL